MRLLLHAVTTLASGLVVTGLRGQPAVRLEQSDLVAWATCFSDEAEAFGRADLLEHHGIISRLAVEIAGVLPARFPTWFPDDAVLRTEIERRQASLIDALERVRGRAEIAVTAMWIATARASPALAATPAAGTCSVDSRRCWVRIEGERRLRPWPTT